MNEDMRISWNEFKVYLQMTLNQYPNISTSDELLEAVFEHTIIPSMRNEIASSTCKAATIHPKDFKSHFLTVIWLHTVGDDDENLKNRGMENKIFI